MRAKKITNVIIPDINPIEDEASEVKSAQPVDTMASLDAANRAEISLKSAKEIRGKAKEGVLRGHHLIELKTFQLFDAVGTDRIDLVRQQSAKASDPDVDTLIQSILENGQQSPVIVRPKDPNWTPRSDDPTNVDGVEFELLAGRRRHLAIKRINMGRDPSDYLPVRARIAFIEPTASEQERKLHALQNRYVENAERADLTAFQSAVSGGQLIAAYREIGHNAEEIEKLLSISHTSRQVWAKAYDQQDALRDHFGSRDPSFDEIKTFVNDDGTKSAQKAPALVKVQGDRGTYTLKPARKSGHVAMNLKVTLNETDDAELIEKLKEVIGRQQAEA